LLKACEYDEEKIKDILTRFLENVSNMSLMDNSKSILNSFLKEAIEYDEVYCISKSLSL